MGTKAHLPGREKTPAEFTTGHSHDDAARAAGPGTRPGTRSLIAEARERARRRAG